MMTKQSKIFSFGKIAYYGTRKLNAVELELELKHENNGKTILSICGNVWNAKHTDIVMGGQCLDTLNEFECLKNNETFKCLYRLWKLYHLNDLHAGTESQETLLENWEGRKHGDYDSDCKYLESKGLLYDNGYKYGSSWLYRPIPENDLNVIKSLLS